MNLRAVEFYAGVGGFHYSLLRSEVSADVVASFDLNPTANRIYRHNFPNTAHHSRNICGLSASELDELEPAIVHMSPPCQPFTRQGLRRDKDDRRTDSFFHLMLIISEMKRPPNYILMENVQGFETSHTRNEFTQMLERVGYTYQEFLLSPNQFSVPNSRLRYYLLAKKRPLSFHMKPEKQPCTDAQFLTTPSHHSGRTDTCMCTRIYMYTCMCYELWHYACRSVTCICVNCTKSLVPT